MINLTAEQFHDVLDAVREGLRVAKEEGTDRQTEMLFRAQEILVNATFYPEKMP
ncbi:MAG: hypothetical protein KGL39_48630 [Patescibacteria group bacterium]|nr:hypothetical protein [Patescibacteria group bacterium]